MHRAVAIAVFLIALPLRSFGQDATPKPPSLAHEIDRLKSGTFDLFDVKFFAQVPPEQAIPVLEAQFEPTKDASLKASIASVLVRLGDKDDTYWNFVVKKATEAVESDEPTPVPDPQGQTGTNQMNPTFVAWAKAHDLSIGEAFEHVMYDTPGFVGWLGSTGDRRAIPLLQRALSSQNFMIQVSGAEGLAEIQDKDSVRLIIQACQRNPNIARAMSMFSLIYFDDPEAQRFVDANLPKDVADERRRYIHDHKVTPFD
jgi:HEAT repeat protein